MDAVIAWSGFVGAWLLVSGPMFQAAVELDVEQDRQSSISRAAQLVDSPPRLSPWWWLLPPVAYVKQRRRRREYRRQVLETLTRDEAEDAVELSNIAAGWAMVAVGAFFIALKETYEVIEHYGWPEWVLAVALVAMIVLCAGSTVVRIRRSRRSLDEAGKPPGRAGAAAGAS